MYSRAAAVTDCCAVTDVVTLWHRAVIVKETTYIHPVQKFPELYGPEIFIIMFITDCLLLVYILRQMNPVHNLLPYFLQILLNIIILPSITRSFKQSLPFRLSNNTPYEFLISPYACHIPIQLIFLVSQSKYCSSRSTKCQIYCFTFKANTYNTCP